MLKFLCSTVYYINIYIYTIYTVYIKKEINLSIVIFL